VRLLHTRYKTQSTGNKISSCITIVPYPKIQDNILANSNNKATVKLRQEHITTVLRPLFRDHAGEPVPEENFWTLWCKGRLTEADTPTIQLGATPLGLSSAHLHHPDIFYRPDALPVAQPTASKH